MNVPKPKVFISYSHNDDDRWYLDQLRDYLQTWEDQDLLEVWYDKQLRPSDDWDETIKQVVETCAVGVLLVSQKFLNSRYINQVELKCLMERWEGKQVRLAHIFLSPSHATDHKVRLNDGRVMELTRFQGLNGPKDTLSRYRDKDHEFRERLVDISSDIRNMVPAAESICAQVQETPPQPEPPTVADRPPEPVTQQEFVDTVRRNIAELLDQPGLPALRDALGDYDLVAKRPSHDVIRDDIERLQEAAQACLEQYAVQGKRSKPLLNQIGAVLGWLVLLAVSEDWVRDQAASRGRLLTGASLDLPVKNPSGSEVLYARLRLQPASLKLEEQGPWVEGENRVDLTGVEMGAYSPNALKEVMKAIWKTLFKMDAPDHFDAAAEEKLRGALQRRYDRGGRSYYTTIPSDLTTSFANDRNLLSLLRAEFPQMAVLMLVGEGGDRALLISEGYLEDMVMEFLQMLEDYR